MKKSVIEKLNDALEEIERRVVQGIEEDAGSKSFLISNHQVHQAMLYFRDVLARRHAEPAQDAHLCRDESIAALDKLIEYHSLRRHEKWTASDHILATEGLKAIRDHLERCYEIRSCD
ncbi:MAG: hypothetical protein E6R03_14420 [Hyphomicrobiaceae bacterium]|nr:MAG: hypothetical protein E6R03_14420 [Hyphomicrobiaceae bacterium]